MSATGCIDRLGSESHAHDCFCQAEESSASFLVSEHQRNKILSLCCSYLHFLCLYTFVSLLNVIIAVCRGQCILSRVLVFLWERATWTVESSVRVKSNFCGHSSSNSIFFSVSLSLGDKPLSFILDCYHKLVRGLISVWLTTLLLWKMKLPACTLRTPPLCAIVSWACCSSIPLWVSARAEPKILLFVRKWGPALAKLPVVPSRLWQGVPGLGADREQHGRTWISSKAHSLFNFFFCFFPLCGSNKPVLQSVAHQRTYFPCSLL